MRSVEKKGGAAVSRYLSIGDLEKIAGRVLRAYAALPQVRGEEICRVDPELLAGALLGLKVKYRHLSRDRKLLGLTAYEEIGIALCGGDEKLTMLDGKTVLVERDLLRKKQTGRRNFTLMHECGHHILKMLYPQDYGTGPDARRVLAYRESGGQFSREEWQADRLAVSLLMPASLVGKAMFLAGLDNEIALLNRCYRRRDYEKFCRMSDMLGVSRQALSIRMTQMGLIRKEQLRDPNSLIDIFMEDNGE